ncbi:MAG: DNA ligase-1 [Phenylobacterium sp.]|jgi:DNA ligase-1
MFIMNTMTIKALLRLFIFVLLPTGISTTAFAVGIVAVDRYKSNTFKTNTFKTNTFKSNTFKPKIQLATVYRQGIDLKAWWVSEKLDGVRAYWNGHQLISRQGNVFAAPDWFTANFPDEPLDGELWIGREQFERVSGIVRQKRADNQAWRDVRLMIFDLPDSSEVFSQRIQQMKTLIEQVDSPYLAMVTQIQLNHQQQLTAMLDRVVTGGGEGLMLHRGESHYQMRRSHDLMKLKRHDDAEARVLKYLPGKGKFKGMMGALLVQTVDGITFKIGTGFSNRLRANPPPIGSEITFKYYGKTVNNVPRFASFLRIKSPPFR